ncbi:uncharacterized protein LOC144452246 isoform X2 [Glandiceps talaboti]
MGRRLCDMFTLILLCSQLVGVDSAETPCGSWTDWLFAIFRSVDLDIFQCCDIKHLRSKISTNENVAVEVELYLLSGETITKDELYKAFIDGAAKTNNTINLESITINVEPEPGPQGLKTGAIVGIVVGSIAVICLIPVCVTVIIYCVKKAGAKAVVGAGSG